MGSATRLLNYFSLPFLLLAPLHAEDFSCNSCTQQFWLSGDYLYWWIKDSPAPIPLVTEGPVVPNQTAVLGRPGTHLLLGGKEINNRGRSGGRFGAGYWFDSDRVFGLEARYLFLSHRSKTKSVYSNGQSNSPFLALLFFDAERSSESSTRIALLGVFSGRATLKVENWMQDAELNGSFKVFNRCDCFDLKILLGFLWWNFNENLTFKTSSPFVIPPIDIFQTKDRFRAHNNFYGGQVGLTAEYLWNRFSLQVRGQIALGAMRGKLLIKGQLVTNDFDNNGAAEKFPAGYLALSTNEGHHHRTRFSVIPQVNADIGYDLANWTSIHIGYTFLYATEVMWASNQIDRQINPSQSPAISGNPSTTVVGVSRPKALFKTKSFWAQGLNVGLQFQF